jgi:signal peptidase
MRTGTVVLVGVLAVVVVASSGVLPVQLSYVTSDSMEPTLSPGDGYVIVEGDVEVGDVVTFSTPDGYVTHRIVGERGDAYVTRGDANPSTDQAGGMPPVEDDQIVGRALTVGGHLVVIPRLGALAGFVAAYRPLLIVGLAVLAAAFALGDRGQEVPARDLLYVRNVVLPLLVGLTVGGVVVLMASVTTDHLTYVFTATGNGPGRLAVGEAAVRTVTVDVTASPLTQTVIDANGVTVVDRAVAGSIATLDVRVPAQSAAGPYTASVSVHSYPAIIPRGLVLWLHGVHPWVACVASTALVFGPVWLVYGLLFDGHSPIRIVSHEGPDGGWVS